MESLEDACAEKIIKKLKIEMYGMPKIKRLIFLQNIEHEIYKQKNLIRVNDENYKIK